MSDQEIKFLPRDKAVDVVAAIQEEEDIHNNDKRILTVYNYDDKEVCWFDYAEVLADVGDVPADQRVEAVQDYILNHIPDWAADV